MSSQPGTFLQLTQAQSSPHCLPPEKHSQYILRQNVFLHVQPILRFLPELAAVWTCEMRSPSESSSGETAGSSMFSRELWLGSILSVLMSLRVKGLSDKLLREGRLKQEMRGGF